MKDIEYVGLFPAWELWFKSAFLHQNKINMKFPDTIEKTWCKKYKIWNKFKCFSTPKMTQMEKSTQINDSTWQKPMSIKNMG